MSWEKVLIVAGTAAALAVLVALLWPLVKHRAIYPGGVLTPAMSDPSMHGLRGAEEVWLEADDGVAIHAWWTPAGVHRREPAPPRGTVIYCHGNAETMATRAWIAQRLARLGLNTLLFDYRGYGLSEGRASEEGLAMDARAAWRHAVEERGADPERIVLMGHSLGSAVAARLALEVQRAASPEAPAALVVGSPFPDMPALFRHHAPWLPGFALDWSTDRLDAGSRLGEVAAPVLVIIGTEDDLIPPSISRAVYEAALEARGGREDAPDPDAPNVRLVTVASDHATLMGEPKVWDALDGFLADVLATGRGRPGTD